MKTGLLHNFRTSFNSACDEDVSPENILRRSDCDITNFYLQMIDRSEWLDNFFDWRDPQERITDEIEYTAFGWLIQKIMCILILNGCFVALTMTKNKNSLFSSEIDFVDIFFIDYTFLANFVCSHRFTLI